MKKIALVLLVLGSISINAEPTMKGTPSELAVYLSKVPRTVSIQAVASEKVVAKKALIKLMVLTEAKYLAEAIEENGRIRSEVRKLCRAAGIKDKDIAESKFSSTPEYGWFGDKPSSYKVENMVSVKVSNEGQLVKVASISDKNKKVHFVSSKALIENEEKIKSALLQKALKVAKQEATIYEKNLSLKLIPVSFTEGGFNVQGLQQNRRVRKSKLASYDVASVAPAARFGESKYSISITVNYKLKAK